jgi:L-cysteine S-thiosulfotransferase
VAKAGRHIALGMAVAVTLGAAGTALALQCTPKTAGFFKEMESASARVPLPIASSGDSRSLTGALGDPQKGRTVMIDPDKGNCIACHRVAALSGEPSHGDLGSTLNGVGSRYTEAQLRQLVVNPKVMIPNTIMPSYHKTEGLERVPAAFAGQPILSAAEVEDVVAFLKTLR